MCFHASAKLLTHVTSLYLLFCLQGLFYSSVHVNTLHSSANQLLSFKTNFISKPGCVGINTV